MVTQRLVGANPAAVITGTERLPGVANFFLGNDLAQWRVELPTYRGVVYQDVYPGVDLRYDGAGRQIKRTYIVRPGADPTRIRWRYAGATGLGLDGLGNLQVTLPITGPAGLRDTRVLTLTEQAPIASSASANRSGRARLPRRTGNRVPPAPAARR